MHAIFQPAEGRAVHTISQRAHPETHAAEVPDPFNSPRQLISPRDAGTQRAAHLENCTAHPPSIPPAHHYWPTFNSLASAVTANSRAGPLRPLRLIRAQPYPRHHRGIPRRGRPPCLPFVHERAARHASIQISATPNGPIPKRPTSGGRPYEGAVFLLPDVVCRFKTLTTKPRIGGVGNP